MNTTSSKTPFSPSRQSMFVWLALAVTAISVIRIAMSYRQMSEVYDEPAHIATGMQMIDRGEFLYEWLHPPLARVSTAILPYLDGARSHGDADMWSEGDDIIHGQGNYWRTLTLARLGIMPYYLLGVFLIWSWSKRLYGEMVAFLSVLFYTLIPPILAHAGLATVDLPLTTALLASSYAFWWWLQDPTKKRSLYLGIVIGLSAAIKFSFIAFFPPVALLLAIYELLLVRKLKHWYARFKLAIPLLAIMALTGWMVLWGTYRFSFGPLQGAERSLTQGFPLPKIDAGPHVPAPEFFDGLASVMLKNKMGHATYFLGKRRYIDANHSEGNPAFFPVALGLKTPIALLILSAAGALLYFFRKRSIGREEFIKGRELIPLIIAAPVILVSIPSNINIGLRHILPIYPGLAMLAALGVRWIWTQKRPYSTVILALLLGWFVLSSFSSGLDNLAYFNEFAGSHPEHFLLDSDLDWGQDADKLGDTLRARGIQVADIFYFGRANLTKLNFPRINWLQPYGAPQSEWVAVSKLSLYTNDGLSWLQSATPVSNIGRSILLYHFNPDEIAKLRSSQADSLAAVAALQPSPEIFLELSLSYYQASRYDDCIAAARKAIALRPNYPEAYNNIAAAFMAESNWESSIAAAQKALDLAPRYDLAKNNLAFALAQKMKRDSLLESSVNAATEKPTPDNLLNLSLIYYQAGKYADCIATTKKALKLKPDFADAYNNMAAGYMALNQWDSAISAANEAIRIKPDYQLAKNNLAYCLTKQQEKVSGRKP